MTTPLKQGRKLARVVPSRCHDARRTKQIVVEIDHTGLLPIIRFRPARQHKGVSITVDGAYELLIRQSL